MLELQELLPQVEALGPLGENALSALGQIRPIVDTLVITINKLYPPANDAVEPIS